MAIQIGKHELDELTKAVSFKRHWDKLSTAFNPKEQCYLFSSSTPEGRTIYKMIQDAEAMGVASWVDFQNRQMTMLLGEE